MAVKNRGRESHFSEIFLLEGGRAKEEGGKHPFFYLSDQEGREDSLGFEKDEFHEQTYDLIRGRKGTRGREKAKRRSNT